jgi:hypothetical protein
MPKAALSFLLLLACAPAWAAPALRLKVDGGQLIEPSGKPIVLTGFNWVLSANHIHAGEGKFMKSVLPNTNVVRLVGILWDNENPPQPGTDCMTSTPPYFDDACFKQLDFLVEQAAAAGIWVILTMRGAEAATNVFNDPTLRAKLYMMWGHVAAHYKDVDYIAAYEIMSEPRDKSATPTQVRDFYTAGCAAAQAVDPATPCMVGPGPYYKLWHFDEDMIITNNSNVIYTFDYFVPERFSFGKEQMPTYPGTYKCDDLYRGFSHECCTGQKGGNEREVFNATWNKNNFQKWAVPVRKNFSVPIFVNQWGVVHGVNESAGRYAYMSDTARSLQELNIGWTWWVWRGGGADTWAHGSMEFVYEHTNGTVEVDQLAVDAVKPYMGSS